MTKSKNKHIKSPTNFCCCFRCKLTRIFYFRYCFSLHSASFSRFTLLSFRTLISKQCWFFSHLLFSSHLKLFLFLEFLLWICASTCEFVYDQAFWLILLSLFENNLSVTTTPNQSWMRKSTQFGRTASFTSRLTQIKCFVMLFNLLLCARTPHRHENVRLYLWYFFTSNIIHIIPL